MHTLDQLLADQYAKEIVFFDVKGLLPSIISGKYSVISTMSEVHKYFQKVNSDFIVTLGQPRLRERLTKRIMDAGGSLVTIISKKAVFISTLLSVDSGSIIQPGCAISHNVQIGRSCVLHASTLVGHDVVIEDYVTIGSMVNILKGVTIDRYSTISPSAIIHQNIRIGKNAYIATGAIVSKDVKDNETVGCT